jgi:hypothetical protein
MVYPTTCCWGIAFHHCISVSLVARQRKRLHFCFLLIGCAMCHNSHCSNTMRNLSQLPLQQEQVGVSPTDHDILWLNVHDDCLIQEELVYLPQSGALVLPLVSELDQQQPLGERPQRVLVGLLVMDPPSPFWDSSAALLSASGTGSAETTACEAGAQEAPASSPSGGQDHDCQTEARRTFTGEHNSGSPQAMPQVT